MAAEATGQLCLAQNQYALTQDATKGTVSAIAGPFSISLSANDRPVVYDRQTDRFVPVDIQRAITQNAFVPEGHYLVLENPSFKSNGELNKPSSGVNSPVILEVGRKIVIPGPATFPLWPGQLAEAIPGHHLRSNQYLVVRVYNADEAAKNISGGAPDAAAPDAAAPATTFTPGELLVIKGTEKSFYIPTTGFEVLKDEKGSYVREALTLERLEYAILLDEDGNKRYEKGPQVVFPEATERFVAKDNTIKFKAIELNDQMGLYIKVIADYTEEGHNYVTGEELFVTGKQKRIYYPRPEHALIEYKDPTKDFMRQRYYGITIPKGEGRFVLDKTAGEIKKVEGPMIFLPDPRNEVIVRRVLDERTVDMWYPGNEEALTFNRTLRSLAEESTSYLADSVVLGAAADTQRGMNRMNANNMALTGSFEGSKIARGSKFTPPPMLTLNTKFDGVPSIQVWTGYAVQVVDKSGGRRVVVGPATILLEYDETLEVLELSTGKPKTTDNLKRDVYLRVDNNLVSDVVRVESKDLVGVEIKLSYRVNFLREHQDKWFSVENYVKYLCDQMRSHLKAALKKRSVKDIVESAAAEVRDVVLGARGEGQRHRFFPENGMDVYDVDVLEVKVSDPAVAALLKTVQTKSVEGVIQLAADEQTLINTKRKTEIDKEVVSLQTEIALYRQEHTQKVNEASSETTLAAIAAELKQKESRLNGQVAEQAQLDTVAQSALDRLKAEEDYTLALDKARAEIFAQKLAAVSPNLIAAITTIGDNKLMAQVTEALAPLAIADRDGINAVMERLFAGTSMQRVLENVKGRSK